MSDMLPQQPLDDASSKIVNNAPLSTLDAVSRLYDARDWEKLFAVLDTVEYGHMKLHYDRSMYFYAQDLNLGQQAATWEGWTFEEGLALLPRLWRYTLLRCSIRSRAESYTPEEFEALLWLGREQEVRGLAELVTKPDRKAALLKQIAGHIGKQSDWEQEYLLIKCQDIARLIREGTRVDIWQELGIALSQTQQWEQKELVIRTIKGDASRAEALAILGCVLARAQQQDRDEALWNEAEAIIRTIKNSFTRPRVLKVLAIALIQAEQLERAERTIHMIEHSSYQNEALLELGVATAKTQSWERAEQIIRTIKGPQRRIEAMLVGALLERGKKLVLTQQMAEAEAVWNRVETIIDSINEYSEYNTRVDALRSFVITLTQVGQWQRAKKIVNTIKLSKAQVELLMILGKALTHAGEWQQAEDMWQRVNQRIISLDSETKVNILLEIGMAQAKAQQWDAAEATLARAEATLHELKEDWTRAKALWGLGMAFAQVRQPERAEETFAKSKELLHTIEHSSARSQKLSPRERVLLGLGIALMQAHEWEHAEQILSTIKEAYERDEALGKLAIAFAQAQQWEHAERVMRTIKRSHFQETTRRKLNTYLIEAQQQESIKQATEVNQDRTLRSETFIARSRILTTPKTLFIQAQQLDRVEIVLMDTETIVRVIKSPDQRDESFQEQVFASIQAQQQERARHIAKMLGGEAVSQILHIALIQAQQLRRDKGLQEYAAVPIQAQQLDRVEIALMDTETIIRVIKSPDQRDEGLQVLALSLIQAERWENASQIAGAITNSRRRIKVLVSLGIALGQAQLWEQAEKVWTEAEALIGTIEEDKERVKILSEAANSLAAVRNYKQLLRMVQRSWLRADTREYAIELLPLAYGLIPLKPDIGISFFEAFALVDTLLNIEETYKQVK